MATQVPPKKNAGFTFYISLRDQADTKLFKTSPTLAAGDFKVTTDDAAPANLGTLPVVDADFTKRVKVVLSASEMNGDNVTMIASDAAGAEWADLTVNIQTVTRQIDDLAYQLLEKTTIATLATQLSFTLTAGSADNDAYNGCLVVVTDATTGVQKTRSFIDDYVGATKTVTLGLTPKFTIAVGDTIDIIANDSNLNGIRDSALPLIESGIFPKSKTE